MEEFIRQCLEGVPEGNYRTRTEKELRDHLECQRRALLEAGRTEAEARAETLGLMGDPEKLKEEYLAAWRRSLPGRLAVLGFCLRTWAKGLGVMFCMLYAACYPRNWMCDYLIGDLRETHLYWLWDLIPLACSLVAGALYLDRRFRNARHSAALTSAGVLVHWANVTAFDVWWYIADHAYRANWEAAVRYLSRNIRYISFTFVLCILLGVLFAQKRERSRELA